MEFSLSEKVDLIFRESIPMNESTYSKKIAELILRFPERFQNFNLGIEFENEYAPRSILFELLAKRPNLILNKVRV